MDPYAPSIAVHISYFLNTFFSDPLIYDAFWLPKGREERVVAQETPSLTHRRGTLAGYELQFAAVSNARP